MKRAILLLPGVAQKPNGVLAQFPSVASTVRMRTADGASFPTNPCLHHGVTSLARRAAYRHPHAAGIAATMAAGSRRRPVSLFQQQCASPHILDEISHRSVE
jgi:hypothetical protein